MSTATSDKTVRQAALYTELQKHVQSSDYEKAMKSCNRLLHEAPDDVFAFECKMVCCLKLSRFEDALDFAVKNPTMIGNLYYELAYCHYRLNQTQDAIDMLEKITNPKDARKKELYCQILYRLERYDECYDLYKEVVKSTSDNYEDERQSNVTAIAASLRSTNNKRKLTVQGGKTFEQKYNYACFHVAENMYESAVEVLLDAEKTCEDTLRDEGVPEDEIQDELCIMKAQRAYCYQKLGREKEAMRMYNSILKMKPTDIAVAAVVSNNVVVQNRDQNIFESKKRMKAMNVESIGYKLTAAQKLTIQLNQCLYYMLTNQDDLCKELYTKLLNEEGKDSDDVFCLAACHNFRLQKFGEIVRKEDLSIVKGKPHLDLKIRLGVMKMALEKGDVETAIKTARKLAIDRGFPLGLVSSLVVMLRHYKSKTDVSDIFQTAIKHSMASQEELKGVGILWKQGAAFEIEMEEYTKADHLLQEFLSFDPDDVLGIALLLTVYIHFQDQEKIKGLSERVPDPSINGIDVEALESESLVGSLKYVKKGGRGGVVEEVTPKLGQGDANEAAAVVKRKKKKKKKGKLPKDYDAKRVMDPERWLPRFERSGYKPKKSRRGRADVGKGTQGAASDAADAFDMSRGPVKSSAAADTPKQKRNPKKGKSKN